MSKNQADNGAPKVGVYVCHCGGNISDHVDIQALVEAAGGLENVALARENSFMCSDPGQEMIMEDIKSGKVNRIVVASCAPSLHESTFRGAISRAGLNPYLYEHANIREQVSWVHHGPGATEKAAALVAAAVGKAANLDELEPIRVEALAHATVIGGGIAGMSAARSLAAAGLKVTLVEKSPFLGGRVAILDKTFPDGGSAAELIAEMAGQIMADELVEVITCAELSEFSGYVGNFSLKLRLAPPHGQDMARLEAGAQPGTMVPWAGYLPAAPPRQPAEVELPTGAIVLATGFDHYTPPMGEYGYGQHQAVITLPELIRLMAEEPGEDGLLVFNGKPVQTMALIHCVGSRQIAGIHEPPEGRPLNEHCSRVCCTASLQAALEMREKYPDTTIYELYRDIRAYGRGHEDYYLNAGKAGVNFIRFQAEAAPAVAVGEADEPLTLSVSDSLLAGTELEIEADLVVLAVGMEPRDNSGLVSLMKLPTGADRFLLEVHPKLRPVELPAAGIYLAGACQAPMDTSEAANAASAAAAKAGAILSRGHVELDPFVAQIDEQKCTGCGQCLEACLAEDAIEMARTAAGGKARVNPALCMGCGVCVAACPEDAIELAGWTLRQYEAMVDAIVARAAQGGI